MKRPVILLVTLSLVSGLLGLSAPARSAELAIPGSQAGPALGQITQDAKLPQPGEPVPFDRSAKQRTLDSLPAPADVTGPQKVVVLRVYFHDYANTSTYSKAQVEGFFDDLDKLWRNTSYNTISIDYQVSGLYQLPDNRSAYIDDFSDGDLSNGGKFGKVLTDAIANAPSGLDWTGVDAINVLMAETDTSQFHRGQATKCDLPLGPGGPVTNVGCAIFSENPGSTQNETWGRFAHELGHAFQAAGPAHPSNYNNEFELMDHNYPGQTGVFEKQASAGFPGWLPGTKYQVVTPTSGGALANIWAVEYDPALQPNVQAVKAEITSSLYYLISVRRRVLGDDLHAADSWHSHFSPNGIPNEGVLIERVSEGSDPWVTVQGPGGDRNKLWQEGDAFHSTSDGISITIGKKLDANGDSYEVRISYDEQASMQPDIGMEPWTSPPGNTWETTDIWFDSPVNGYDSYRFGYWNDIYGNPVPVGNGDIPAVGLVNRVYARVRNFGYQTATDVKVHFELTDPPGVGIAGASGWVEIGSVDKTAFPGLAAIPPGDFVDVYLEWTPDFAVPPGDMADGLFDFHTCLRVKMDPVTNETVFGNQDGDREQENISTFQSPESAPGATTSMSLRLFNDDLKHSKFFYLNYDSDLPSDWGLDINGGDLGIELAPGEVRNIPVKITPSGTSSLGSVFGVDIKASSLRLLKNEEHPSDQHPEYNPLGGVRFEARVVRPPKLDCKIEKTPNGLVFTCNFTVKGFENFYDPKKPFKVLLVGYDKYRHAVPDATKLAEVQPDGSFSGMLPVGKDSPVDQVSCLFDGSDKLASASCGYVITGFVDFYIPVVTK